MKCFSYSNTILTAGPASKPICCKAVLESNISKTNMLIADILDKDKLSQNVKDNLSEVYINALSGGINFNKSFYADSYCYKIENNNKLVAYKSAPKNVFIDTSVRYADAEINTIGGVSLDTLQCADVAEGLKDGFELVIEEDEFEYAIKEIKNKEEEISVEMGYNIKHLIAIALKGVPQACSELKKICRANDQIGELIRIILSSGKENVVSYLY